MTIKSFTGKALIQLENIQTTEQVFLSKMWSY